MKISNSNANLVNQTYTNQANSTLNQSQAQTPEKKSGPSGVDSVVNLSASTKDLQKVFQALEVEPSGRAEKVAEIKKKVQQGRYVIEPETIAAKILDEFV